MQNQKKMAIDKIVDAIFQIQEVMLMMLTQTSLVGVRDHWHKALGYW